MYKFLAAFLLGLMSLTACGNTPPTAVNTQHNEVSGLGLHYREIIINNRTLSCVAYKNYEAGGLSCNWEAYNHGRLAPLDQ